MKFILIALSILTFAGIAYAATPVQNVPSGGTGNSTFTSSRLLYGNGTAALSSVATTTYSISGPFTISGTLGALVGGSNSTVTYWGLSTTSQPTSSQILVSNGAAGVYGVSTSTLTANNGLTGSFTHVGTTGSLGLATINAGVLGAVTNGAVPTSQATSSLYGAATPGQVLGYSNGGIAWVSTTSSASGASYSFTPGTFGATKTSATSTAISDTQGFIASSTSYFDQLNVGNLATPALIPSGSVTVSGYLQVGSSSPSAYLPNEIADFNGNQNGYAGITVRNVNAGTSASADLLINTDKTTALPSYYTDLGQNSSGNTMGGFLGDQNGSYLYNSDGSFSLETASSTNPNAYLRFGTGGVEAMRITNTGLGTMGNIGIGTTTPNWLTQVSGTRPSIALSDAVGGANKRHWLFSSMGGNLYIGTSTDLYATSTPGISIANNGFVGIGTANPLSPLHISNGASGVWGTVPGAFRVSNVNGAPKFFLTDSTNWDAVMAAEIVATQANSKLHWYINNAASTPTDAIQMVLTGAGNVGIGTSSPASKLSVVGSTYLGGSLLATSTVQFSNFGQGVLVASSTGVLSSIATSTLYGAATPGQVLAFSNGGIAWMSTTSGSGNSFSFPWTPSTYGGFANNSTTTSLYLPQKMIISSSTYFTTASSSILEMTYYVQNFPGSDLGAKFNNAYAQAPNGSKYIISASSTWGTNPMSMSTAGKVGTIVCSPGVVLTWTGTATSTILNATDINNLYAGWGIQGCTIRGTGGSGQVGIQLGGSNGGQGAVIEGNDIGNFGNVGLRTEANTWNINILNNWFGTNKQAVHIESANNSGEGFRFRGNTYADCSTNYNDCFYSEINGSDGLSFDHDVWDDAGIHLLDGNLNNTFTAPKFENPNASVIGRYNYMTLDSGGFMQTTIIGGDFMNGANSVGNSPNQFILNGGQLSLRGVTFDNNTGGSISMAAAVNNYGGGRASVYGYKDVNSGTKTVTTFATSSTPFLFDENGANISGLSALGIGTSTPAANLQLWDRGTNVEEYITRADGAQLKFKAQDNQSRITFPTGNLLIDRDDAGTNVITMLNSTGSTGFATSTPVGSVDIYTSVASTTPLLLESVSKGGCIIIKDVGSGPATYTQVYTQAGAVFGKVHTGSLATCN
jgi:hypothetical protein